MTKSYKYGKPESLVQSKPNKKTISTPEIDNYIQHQSEIAKEKLFEKRMQMHEKLAEKQGEMIEEAMRIHKKSEGLLWDR